MSEVRLVDVVDKIGGNVDRFTTDLLYYAGGEHYIHGNLEILSGGLIKGSMIGFKFHFPFKKGDSLFMSRSFSELRKAGRANFDGLCSDTSYIFRTKDESVLLPDFLPIILQSEHFCDYCILNETGSVNTLVNWTVLKEYTFDLPSLEVQKKAFEQIWGIQSELNLLKRRLTILDQLTKSRFNVEQQIQSFTQLQRKLLDHYVGGEQ